MNNILDAIFGAQGGTAVDELARNFGLDREQVNDVVRQVTPAMARGVKRNTLDDNGLADLIGALQKGNHARYVEQPEILTRPETVDNGNGILGHIFGSKDVSRNVARHAAEKTGVSDSIIKKMLPMLATLVMGSLAKKATGGFGGGNILGSILGGGSTPARAPASQGGLGDVLGGFLDADKDGSMLDDLIGMAGKFMR